jgi:hypothetical protein
MELVTQAGDVDSLRRAQAVLLPAVLGAAYLNGKVRTRSRST